MNEMGDRRMGRFVSIISNAAPDVNARGEKRAESARESVMGTGREADIRIFRENFEKYGRNFQNPLT